MFRKIGAAVAAILTASTVAFAAGFLLPDGSGFQGHMHVDINGKVPVCTSCTLTSGSTDMAGEFSPTGTSGAVLTFGVAYGLRPFCNINNKTTPADSAGTVSTTAITMGTTVASDKIGYICFAQTGG